MKALSIAAPQTQPLVVRDCIIYNVYFRGEIKAVQLIRRIIISGARGRNLGNYKRLRPPERRKEAHGV